MRVGDWNEQAYNDILIIKDCKELLDNNSTDPLF
jgi:hypothetical protein